MQETLQTVLSSLLEAVLILVIPTAVGFLWKQLHKLFTAKGELIENEYARGKLMEARDMISDIVGATTQTFVESLKAAGTFDIDSQVQALNQSFTTAKKMLNDETQALIVKTHSDLDTWIKTEIEAFVLKHKLEPPAT